MVALSSEYVVLPANLPRFIYITGCDGTGKTTQSRLLLEQLLDSGVNARLVWLRFPFFFSLLLLAYARLRGYSWFETTGDVRHGYWDFRSSWAMKTLLPWLLFLDATLATFFVLTLSLLWGKTIVCERFVLDMIADLGVALARHNLHRQLPYRLFLKLIPKSSKVFFLDADASVIRQRRADLIQDRQLEIRLEVYRRIAQDLEITVLSSLMPVAVVNRKVIEMLEARNE